VYYRHGCVIVRGGKVNGQGFNDPRPGYNGEEKLKSDRMTSADGPAVVVLKRENRKKELEDLGKAERAVAHARDSEFGGGHMANMPLTIHSEMMAIKSALSLSNALGNGSARGVQWIQKPRSFKLQGRGKRQLQL